MENKNININISTLTILKVLLIIIIIAFLFYIKEVIALIFVALVLASAFDPWVDWFHKRRIPRGLALIILYILLLGVVSLAVVLIIPPITAEISQVAKNFPFYYEKVMSGIGYLKGVAPVTLENQISESLINLGSDLPGAVGNIFSLIFGFFGGMISFFMVLVITFYFTVHEEGLKSFIRSLTPSKTHPYINQLIYRIQRKMGDWLRGQLILSLIIAALAFIGLSILGVQYALLLALIAGILEVVPFLGPSLAAIPAAFFGFLQSPLTGLLVIALYVVIQQAENQLITPKVMGRTVGLNPLIVIIVILVGAKLGGIVGALLSVPVATAISVFAGDFFEKKAEDELQLHE